MSIFKIIKQDRFCQISNDLINDPRLSLRAKGLLCYLISKPVTWNLNVNHLYKTCKEGKDAIYSTINELIESGYIVRVIAKDSKGRHTGVDYHVYEEPQRENPEVEIPSGEKPDNSNTELLVNKEVSKAGEPATQPKDEKKELRDKTIAFMKLVIDWGIEHPDKYPKLLYKQFVIYWTEQNLGGKKLKLRYEEQKFFDVGRRLATWFSKAQDQDLQKMWQEEKKLPSVNEIFKEILGVNGKQ